ncbi:MAG TPA: Gfo/Idh/MocA family oxidoreductase [Geminicoccaceae bacterium]|nr:Gfo/Idh/MocA family oxidoreductase [Geminicoccaceae bacterium]
MQPVKLGIVGCGVISDAYLKGASRSRLVAVKSCTDLVPEAAAAKAAAHGILAVGIEAMLADPEVEIVLNLTVPLAHAEVSLRAVEAGKHVYSEKPIATTFSEGRELTAAARAKGVRLGAAPDTFLGAAHQAVRRALDAGRIGRVVAGSACFAGHGMEAWHPNPFFFYRRGGGPVLDIGPYPVTQLVNLLGPVESVTAQTSRGFATRTVTSEPRRGEVIEVEVPTTVNAALAFANGANVGLLTSWDVWKHAREPIELYGSEGTLLNPDPNFFGGRPRLSERNGAWRDLPIDAHPFGVPNRRTKSGAMVADYRMLGVLDMAQAIREGRPHRANGDLALHVLEVLSALERSSVEGQRIRIETICERPEPVPLGRDETVFVTGSG